MVVDRDIMSSGLMANALVRDLNCEAVGVPHSELLRVLETKSFDILIVSADLNGKPGSGIDLANAASCAQPELPIAILMDSTTRETVINAFRSGARGVFDRDEPVDSFLDCVEQVRKGLIWAGAMATAYLLEALRNLPTHATLTQDLLAALTARESQVVQHAARGETNKTIAKALGLSEHTVKNYLFRAFEKLGVSNRIELLYLLTARGSSPASLSAPQGTKEADES